MAETEEEGGKRSRKKLSPGLYLCAVRGRCVLVCMINLEQLSTGF